MNQPLKLETEPDETGVYAPPTATDPGEFKPGDYSFEVNDYGW